MQEDISWLLDSRTDKVVARTETVPSTGKTAELLQTSMPRSDSPASWRRFGRLWGLLILLPVVSTGSWLIRTDDDEPQRRVVIQVLDVGVDSTTPDTWAAIDPDASQDAQPVARARSSRPAQCGVDTIAVELSPKRSAYGPADRIRISGIALDCRNRPLRGVRLRWSVAPAHCAKVDAEGRELAQVACTGRVKACVEGGETCSSAYFRAEPKAILRPTVCDVELDNAALEVGERLEFEVVCRDDQGRIIPGARPEKVRLVKVAPAQCAELMKDFRSVDLLCECTGEIELCVGNRCKYKHFSAMDGF